MRNQDTDDGERRRKKHLVLLFILFLITVTTSAITGYLLGRTAQIPAGRMVDTIELGPDTGADSAEEEALIGRKIHLAGQILYTDGTPAANSLVQLHSEPRETYTDRAGRFFFDSVETGNHTVTVLKDGQVVAQNKVEITQEPGKRNLAVQQKVKTADHTYEMIVNTTVRLIEVELELDQQGQTLSVRGNTAVAVTDDGAVVTSAGMRRSDNPMVLKSGTVVTSDHTILLTDTVITPANEIGKIPEEGILTADGITAKPDGEKELPGGVKVTAEGKLEGEEADKYLVNPEAEAQPGGAGAAGANQETNETGETGQDTQQGAQQNTQGQTGTNQPGQTQTGGGQAGQGQAGQAGQGQQGQAGQDQQAGVQQPQGGTNQPGETQPGESQPGGIPQDGQGIQPGENQPQPGESQQQPGQSQQPGESGGSQPGITGPGANLPGGGSGGTGGGGSTSRPGSGSGSGSGGGSGNRPQEDDGQLGVSEHSADGSWNSWDVLSTLDLFYHKEGTADNGKICPGSKGYYDFKVSNTRKEALTYTISIEETKMHIPMRFRLRNMDQEKFQALSWQGPFTADKKQLIVKQDAIAAGTEINYRLEWDWPYDGDDEADTLAGQQAAEGEQYYLSLMIRAQAQ